MTMHRIDCDEECWAEDRSDCFDMEDDRLSKRDPWDRPRAMMGIGPALIVPVGQCSCDCHDEYD